jgi:hypothetical protein
LLQGTGTIQCKEGCPIGYSVVVELEMFAMATGGVEMNKCLVSPALGNAMILFWAATIQNYGLKWPVDVWHTVQHMIIFGVLCGYLCAPNYFLRTSRCLVYVLSFRCVNCALVAWSGEPRDIQSL